MENKTAEQKSQSVDPALKKFVFRFCEWGTNKGYCFKPFSHPPALTDRWNQFLQETNAMEEYASLQCAEMKKELELQVKKNIEDLKAADDLMIDYKRQYDLAKELNERCDELMRNQARLNEENERLKAALGEKTIDVMYAESWYELADISHEFGVTWMHIYDEPPSRHIDRVKWASITNIRIKPLPHDTINKP